jgi:hypothetical protein
MLADLVQPLLRRGHSLRLGISVSLRPSLRSRHTGRNQPPRLTAVQLRPKPLIILNRLRFLHCPQLCPPEPSLTLFIQQAASILAANTITTQIIRHKRNRTPTKKIRPTRRRRLEVQRKMRQRNEPGWVHVSVGRLNGGLGAEHFCFLLQSTI